MAEGLRTATGEASRMYSISLFVKWIYRVKDQCFWSSGTDNVWYRVLPDPRHQATTHQKLTHLAARFLCDSGATCWFWPCFLALALLSVSLAMILVLMLALLSFSLALVLECMHLC